MRILIKIAIILIIQVVYTTLNALILGAPLWHPSYTRLWGVLVPLSISYVLATDYLERS